MRDVRATIAAVHLVQAELEALASGLSLGPPTNVTSFVRRVFAHLMRADGGLSAEELHLLAGFNRDQFSWHDEVEYARDTVADSPRFLVTVPSFLQAAIMQDGAHGSTVAPQMVEAIRRLCALVVDCDGVAEERELRAKALLLETLTGALADAESFQ